MQVPVLWERMAKNALWKAEEKWKTKGRGLALGGNFDDEYLFRGTMWAHNHWLLSDDKERLMWMVSDIIEELQDLDMAQSRSRCGGWAEVRYHPK